MVNNSPARGDPPARVTTSRSNAEITLPRVQFLFQVFASIAKYGKTRLKCSEKYSSYSSALRCCITGRLNKSFMCLNERGDSGCAPETGNHVTARKDFQVHQCGPEMNNQTAMGTYLCYNMHLHTLTKSMESYIA